MSKNTVASDWTADILRFNAHTPTGKAACSFQLSSATAGNVFEFHLAGAASGAAVPPELNMNVPFDTVTVSRPFSASSVQGADGRAFFDETGVFLLMGSKGGKVPLTATLNAKIGGTDFNLFGLFLLKSVSPRLVTPP